MRILFVWPAAEYSVWDVGRGLHAALQRQGCEIRDYAINKRLLYHTKALGDRDDLTDEQKRAFISQNASDPILAEALYFKADLVFIVSGLNVHPAALWALERVGIPTAVLLTESPYEDDYQLEWLSAAPKAIVFTNEMVSAAAHNWTYVRHAYDPHVHRPLRYEHDEACDVLMVGTGWKDRQELLEAVNWDGIHLVLRGAWPHMTADSPLKRYHEDVCIRNDAVVRLYGAARICLNLHRAHPTARSLNPRAYELAACGAFAITDRRAEVFDVFGAAAETFDGTAVDLEDKIRTYLANDRLRDDVAREQRAKVQGQTFDARAIDILNVLAARVAAAA